MRTDQLLFGALAIVVLSAAACTRAEADRQTRQAAAEVNKAAGVAASGVNKVAGAAGDRLADGWVTSKVQAQYFADKDIKARYINVSTRDGVVTIRGYVESPAAREQALQIARNTDGVRSVDDRLLIGQPPAKETFEVGGAGTAGAVATDGDASDAARNAGALDDDRITSMVQARFYLDSSIKMRSIHVTTRNGVVTLRGSVNNEVERAQALLIARHTTGVGRVEDLLVVDAGL
jgi:hyperosmotically inducible protein